jgi:hypothetical protein
MDPFFSFDKQGDGGLTPWQAFSEVHNTDCATECANGEYWACVGSLSWSGPKPGTTPTAFHFWAQDLAGNFLQGIDTVLCNYTDPNCESPVSTHEPTDKNGEATLEFTNAPNISGQQNLGLAGFVKATSPDYVTVNEFWGYPLSAPASYTLALFATPAAQQSAAQTAKIQIDTNRGLLSVVVYDCAYNPAANVAVTLDSADTETVSRQYDGTPSTVTDARGILLFWNVPAGYVEITATPMALGRRSSVVHAIVHPGEDTQVLVWPTPLP